VFESREALLNTILGAALGSSLTLQERIVAVDELGLTALRRIVALLLLAFLVFCLIVTARRWALDIACRRSARWSFSLGYAGATLFLVVLGSWLPTAITEGCINKFDAVLFAAMFSWLLLYLFVGRTSRSDYWTE
jgi:Na+/phosphate symporter